MAATQPAEGYSLELTRTFAAPPERVFDAWTQPEIMSKWFCRGMATSVVNIYEQELRVGGRLRLTVNDDKGKIWSLVAEYRELRRPERVSFTWRWENEPSFGETLVTVDIRRLGNSNFSEVRLRHEGFPAAEACDGHKAGWLACFAMLETEFPEFAQKTS
jgi:uncharacterized protein YndB with AHSA1/START domain